jgi:hypothetical protein
MLEDRGFSTVVIGSVRYQVEQVRPPRALWVPFQLGRPLGEPEDPAFQRRVIMQALSLLERTDGPVILEDFPDDPPNWQDTPGWQPPDTHAPPPGADPAALTRAFADELVALAPHWQAAQARYGRTSVGLAGQPPGAWPGLAEQVLRGGLPTVPMHETTALATRFMCDDVKALYAEAAQAHGKAPSSRQIDGWFWRSTAAGAVLIALRAAAMASANNALKTVGSRFFVPAPFVPAA